MADPYLPSVFSTGQTPEDIYQLSRLEKLMNPNSGPLPVPPVLSDRHYLPKNFKTPFCVFYAVVLTIVLSFTYARPLVRYTRSALQYGSPQRMFFVVDDLLLILSVMFFSAYSVIGIYGACALQWGFRGQDWTLKSVEKSQTILFASSLISVASLTMIRLDLLIFCRRANERLSASGNRICCWVLCGLSVAYFFSAIVAKVLACGPANIQAGFNVWELAKHHCNGRVVSLGVSAADCFLNILVVSEIVVTIIADRAQRELGDSQPSNLNRPSRMMGFFCVIACLGSIANVHFANSPSLTFTSMVYSHLTTEGVTALFIIASTFQILRRPGIGRRARHASFVSTGYSFISTPVAVNSSNVGVAPPMRPVRTQSQGGKSFRSFQSTSERMGHTTNGVHRTNSWDFDLDAMSIRSMKISEASSVVIRDL